MSIFEKFQNTVFVKDSSELERKIKALTEIKDKVKEKEQIEKEIKQSIVKVDGLIDYLKKDIAKKIKDIVIITILTSLSICIAPV